MKHDVMAGFDDGAFGKLTCAHIVKRAGDYMPLVYICSPFAGDETGNMARARVYSRFALLCGYIPVAPHIYFPEFCYEAEERDIIMRMNMVLLGKCRELWVFGDEITQGMEAEIDRALQNPKVAIRYFTTDLKEKEICMK